MSSKSLVIQKLLAGEKEAKREFYMVEFDRLVRIPLRYVQTKNEAISIVNDSFIKIFKTIDRLEDTSKIEEWTAAITRNTTLDYVRKRVKYEQRNINLENYSDFSLVMNDALENLNLEEILQHIRSLGDKERIVFSMYAIDGYKHAEIAESLEISVGTSKWYLNKARKSLQLILKKYKQGVSIKI